MKMNQVISGWQSGVEQLWAGETSSARKKQAPGQKDLAGVVFCRAGNISVQPVPCAAISTIDHDKYRIPESL